ncbi:hypothetical protein GE061_005108 [Apolygus lucorum]|uniref:Uncharacterized protein n=1 Tax=Apolygus lucorum TaxID=248454 RepID=A0A6A4IN19_APOLU|nr:hypothetical protein GE061_005108 [Apolygus lucorum]
MYFRYAFFLILFTMCHLEAVTPKAIPRSGELYNSRDTFFLTCMRAGMVCTDENLCCSQHCEYRPGNPILSNRCS